MPDLKNWLKSFLPSQSFVNYSERLRASVGALIGIALTGLVSHLFLRDQTALPWLIAPMGASAVLLFAVPASPLAQPWSIIGGNTVAALIGVASARWIEPTHWAAAVAVAGAIAAMFPLRCIHPPSGAVALTAVMGGPAIHSLGFDFVLVPVLLNSALLLSVAIAFNNLTRRRYPHAAQLEHKNVHKTADAQPADRVGFTPADLDRVLKQYNQVLDIARDDLESLFKQTEMQAYRRRFGEITCADIMSRDLVTVEFGSELEEAWSLLRKHKIKALPVVDWSKRLIGIVTLADFMKHADLEIYPNFDGKLRRFIRRTPGLNAEKPEVVGQIMSSRVDTAAPHMHIVELVPLLSDLGHHHIPIVDEQKRLLGMVTQSDLIAALYRRRLEESVA